MKKRLYFAAAVFAVMCAAAVGIFAAVGDYTVLHSFIEPGSGGAQPRSQALATDGAKLYGAASVGGDNNKGTIYSIDMNGGNYTPLYQFAGGADDGAVPMGALVLESGRLYGTTWEGGDQNIGVIFSIKTDGTGFTLLHEFAGGADDGSLPLGSVVISGGVIYGMTALGGDSDAGIIYSLGTDGNGYTVLHEFAGADGVSPFGSLILSGGRLYGMATGGGTNNMGVVFSMNTDGTGFILLHEFTGGADDGSFPYGSLFLFNGKLYGMTIGGGDINRGVIFSINTDGTGFVLLREFAGGADDGAAPSGSFTALGGKLYGMTSSGGDQNQGVLFSINPDGTGFTLLKEIGGLEGASPVMDSPLVSGNFLYGTTRYGGSDDNGVIFRYQFQDPAPPAPVVPQCFINTLF